MADDLKGPGVGPILWLYLLPGSAAAVRAAVFAEARALGLINTIAIDDFEGGTRQVDLAPTLGYVTPAQGRELRDGACRRLTGKSWNDWTQERSERAQETRQAKAAR